jgi:hypothetical protein
VVVQGAMAMASPQVQLAVAAALMSVGWEVLIARLAQELLKR